MGDGVRNLHPPCPWLPAQCLQPCRESSRRDKVHCTPEEHRFWVRQGPETGTDLERDLTHLAVSLPAIPLQNAGKAEGPVVRQCGHTWKGNNDLGPLPVQRQERGIQALFIKGVVNK